MSIEVKGSEQIFRIYFKVTVTKITTVTCFGGGGGGEGVVVGGREMGSENDHLYRGSPLLLSVLWTFFFFFFVSASDK